MQIMNSFFNGLIVAPFATIFGLSVAFAQDSSSGPTWKLSASRVIYVEGSPSETLWLTNTSDRPWLVSAAVFQTDSKAEASLTKSDSLLADPPSATVFPGKRFAVKLVWVGDNASWQLPVERLERLRLKLLPAKDGGTSEQTDKVDMQLAAELWIKVFLRPKMLATDESPRTIEVDCEGSSRLSALNLTPYWITLRSLKSTTSELIDPQSPAPTLAPQSRQELSTVAPCQAPLVGREIDDYGFSRALAAVKVLTK